MVQKLAKLKLCPQVKILKFTNMSQGGGTGWKLLQLKTKDLRIVSKELKNYEHGSLTLRSDLAQHTKTSIRVPTSSSQVLASVTYSAVRGL